MWRTYEKNPIWFYSLYLYSFSCLFLNILFYSFSYLFLYVLCYGFSCLFLYLFSTVFSIYYCTYFFLVFPIYFCIFFIVLFLHIFFIFVLFILIIQKLIKKTLVLLLNLFLCPFSFSINIIASTSLSQLVSMELNFRFVFIASIKSWQ